jgi:hypothetical protein
MNIYEDDESEDFDTGFQLWLLTMPPEIQELAKKYSPPLPLKFKGCNHEGHFHVIGYGEADEYNSEPSLILQIHGVKPENLELFTGEHRCN